MNTNFKVIGLTRLGIKSKSTAPEADTLTTRQFELGHAKVVIQRFIVRVEIALTSFICLNLTGSTSTIFFGLFCRRIAFAEKIQHNQQIYLLQHYTVPKFCSPVSQHND